MRTTTTMRWMTVLLTLTTFGCASMQSNRTLCRAVWTGAGATLGGVGGGVGVNEIENNPSDGEVAVGAVLGALGGGLIGALAGYYACPEPPPPPAPPVARPAPPPPAGTKIATIPGPNFDFNKSTLRPEGRQRIADAARVLKANPTVNVYVDGYTDSVGSDAYNLKLGEQRARTVERALIEEGINANRLSVRSFGKKDPIASNATADGRAANRRVEIVAR